MARAVPKVEQACAGAPKLRLAGRIGPMIRVHHDGFTTAELTHHAHPLILAACVHCPWLAAGNARAVAIGKAAHLTSQHPDIDGPSVTSLPLQ